MKIHSYEDSVRARACADLTRKCGDFGKYDEIILLPIPTTRDGVTLTGSGEKIETALSEAGERTLAVGYELPDRIREELEKRGVGVLDVGLDEEFLKANGELTAEAVLAILLTTEPRAPRDLSVGVVGYGRIGRRITGLLLYLGADVRVYTSRDGVRLELCEFGVASRMSLGDADLSGLDILINTAPARIFNLGEGGRAAEGLRIIDLASGDNFGDGVKVEKYPSVPAKMFPYSAGRIWHEAIVRFLRKG
jgi:hypothetical protein